MYRPACGDNRFSERGCAEADLNGDIAVGVDKAVRKIKARKRGA
jgi:hypothetical protein